MKYYLDYAEVTVEETGYVWPQISRDSPAYAGGRSKSFWNLRATRFPSFIPDLDYLLLAKEAKLTDVLSTPVAGADDGIVKGMLITSRLKTILESHRLPPSRYYPAIVKTGGASYPDYHFLHIVFDSSPYIDYAQTDFRITHFNNDLGPVQINSKEELRAKSKQLDNDKIISSRKLYLKKDVVFFFDLFVETSFTFRTYISERLRERLLLERITGISIDESSDLALA